jgi:dienelactone hydrolase
MGHLAHGPANRRRRVLETAAPLFVCEPSEAPRGGVIVVHDVLGLTHDAEAACRRLARGGWLAVAPFLYHQHGGPAVVGFGIGGYLSASAACSVPGVTAAVTIGAVDPDGLWSDARPLAELVSSSPVPLLGLGALPDPVTSDDTWERIDAFLASA